jgi:hypothetical protein
MNGKIPDFQKLRNQFNALESRLSFNQLLNGKNKEVDEELHNALKTKPKAHSKSYDKELINKAKLEIELIQKELINLPSDDSLCLSSESESKLSTSFKISKSSARSRTRSRGSKPLKGPDMTEVVKRLQNLILEKDKRIEILEEKLVEKQQIAENSLKKLSQTTKLIKVNEKDINCFKKECEDKLDDYKKIIFRLEVENKELSSRAKNAERERDEVLARIKKSAKKDLTVEDLKKQNNELRIKFEDSIRLAESLQERYESLVESSMVFEEKTRDLYKANQVLQENIIKLLPDD